MNINFCSTCVCEQFTNICISLTNEHGHCFIRVRSVRLQPQARVLSYRLDLLTMGNFSDGVLIFQQRKKNTFHKKQESARKDIERAFGVLKRRWSIIAQLACSWARHSLRDIMYTCIIPHNMILGDGGMRFVKITKKALNRLNVHGHLTRNLLVGRS
ncbi:putative harbinger transposase-derived protein [Helianthus annuus]|nr:putative harbinger transposase-derived protein [Helianthus annuus]